jgi:hypothetical protein
VSEVDLVMACRDIRLLASVWWAAWMGMTIVAITGWGMYQWGIRARIPRKNATLKRLARERDVARAELIKAGIECETLRRAMETVGREAEKEIKAADAKADRERAIRKKTEDRLSAQNSQLDDARGQAEALEGLLLAVNAHHTIEPGAPGSWVPSELAAASLPESAQIRKKEGRGG